MYSLTETAKKKNPDNPSYVIQSWLRDINTLQFLYLWKKITINILSKKQQKN